ncbi:hypothetical protein ACA910_008782 [Epithemia clementina (nom. ined.)]
MLHNSIGRIRDSAIARFSKINNLLASMEYKLSVLKTLIGNQIDNQGTASLFVLLGELSALHNGPSVQFVDPLDVNSSLDFTALVLTVGALDQEFKRFKTSITGVVHAEIQHSFASNLFDPSCPFQQNLAQPAIGFLWAWSSNPATPGDKLGRLLKQIDARIQKLEQDWAILQQGGPLSGSLLPIAPSAPFSNSPSVFGWGGGSSGGKPAHFNSGVSSGPVGGVGVSVHFEVETSKKLRELHNSLEAIQDQLKANSVEIGTETFKSKIECAAWLATNNAISTVYLFMDAVSFLSLCTCDAHKSEHDAAQSRATTVKIWDTNTYQTAYVGSFSLEVPPLLGKGQNADATRATKTLAAVQTFEDFHPGGGHEGVKARIMYYAKDGVKTLDTLLGEAFNRSSLPYVVARTMLMASYAFWDEFCRWIISYHDDLLGKSNASTQEVWTLNSHCVRAVFKSLRTARACGRAFNSPEGVFWGALQAHGVMVEFKEAEFSGHPKIALILHEHLINFSTPLSQFEAFQKKSSGGTQALT